MAELATLARPYARAVFAVAQDSGAVDAFGQGLALLGAAASAPEVAAMLAAPRPGPAVKAQELAAFLLEQVIFSIEVMCHYSRVVSHS